MQLICQLEFWGSFKKYPSSPGTLKSGCNVEACHPPKAHDAKPALLANYGSLVLIFQGPVDLPLGVPFFQDGALVVRFPPSCGGYQ